MILTSLLLSALPTVLDDCSKPVAQSCSSGASLATASGPKSILETAAAAGSFTTLGAAIDAAGLTEALEGDGPFTVFAPTDDAFSALPEGTVANLLKPENRGTLQAILKYHVVAGKVPAAKVVDLDFAGTLNGQRVDIEVGENGVTVDGAKVVTTDIECSNGIIHVIDAVILPSTDDIVTTAVAAGSFKTLAQALKAAGLVEALKGDGPFTVFAPTDDAFAKLPEGTVANLLKPENKQKLVDILKFHVVPGRVYSDAAAKGATVDSLLGKSVVTRSEGGKVFVNGATVVKADIETSNGVIHVIDSVLLPQ